MTNDTRTPAIVWVDGAKAKSVIYRESTDEHPTVDLRKEYTARVKYPQLLRDLDWVTTTVYTEKSSPESIKAADRLRAHFGLEEQ